VTDIEGTLLGFGNPVTYQRWLVIVYIAS